MIILYFALAICILDLYAYQLVRFITKNKYVKAIYVFITLILAGFILFTFYNIKPKSGQSHEILIAFGLFSVFYIPKLWIFLILFLEDIFRVLFGLFHINKFSKLKSNPANFFTNRFKLLQWVALFSSLLFFGLFAHGILIGRYKYRVIKQEVYFDNLPKSFNGFKILQLSDIHLGSLNKPEKIAQAIKMINNQDFDVLVFTGDLVNNKAEEIDPWYNILSKIKTPEYGKFAILGNHDYGDYVSFKNDKEKQDNFNALKSAHNKLGYNLLLDTHQYLKSNQDSIALIGVENWGYKFKQIGNLSKAVKGVNAKDFKIVLSHDPSHFEQVISTDSIFYDLTLSGHTHGLQFGIELDNGFQWSPVQFMYKYWAGLYQKDSRYLYVNRGFGYHAYPGRVGIWPEITVITLKSKNN